MRRFIRHPTAFPIVVVPKDVSEGDEATLCDISLDGLACSLRREYLPESPVSLEIPSIQKDYRFSGRVVRCERCSSGYRVAIQFSDETESFKSKMVEQVCQIEHYRQELHREGRQLDSEAAAREWIELYGREFAEIFSG